MDIRVGVKYCGGCNPNYDRRAIADIIESRTGVKLSAYMENEIPDVALIICGCRSDCIKQDDYRGRYETILISGPEQIDGAMERIISVNSNIAKYSE